MTLMVSRMSDGNSHLTISDTPTAKSASDGREPTLFAVLATRARGHPRTHLWGATLFGAADAVAILFAYPSAWWLASASVALAAFGIWGLIDEALPPPLDACDGAVMATSETGGDTSTLTLRLARATAAGIGIAASLIAAFGFMAAALGTIVS